jgi:hypothetical protein
MKKLVLAAVMAGFLGIAQAEGTYASATYDFKDKQNSTQNNYVYGLNVGQKFSDGWAAEVRMEDEKVDPGAGATQKQEGLAQIKVSKDFALGMVTPYVAAAVGQKNKSTSDFPFWVGELGAKVKLGDSVTARYGWRQRTAFDTTANSYNTREHTLALGFNVTKQDAVTVAYKKERGTSDYNTTGLYYTRSF